MKHFHPFDKAQGRRAVLFFATFLCAAPFVAAQQSASYKLNEHTLNAGGNPAGGAVLTSTNYRLSLDALGDSVAEAGTLSSASYRSEAGFVPPYPPPGEALNLLFTDPQTLAWNSEKSVGTYNLYRGLLSDLPANYSTCSQAGLAAATATDAATPPSGQTYFYLVTAENRLSEEGVLGQDSAPVNRPNGFPCP